jgi:hypothetical protein
MAARVYFGGPPGTRLWNPCDRKGHGFRPSAAGHRLLSPLLKIVFPDACRHAVSRLATGSPHHRSLNLSSVFAFAVRKGCIARRRLPERRTSADQSRRMGEGRSPEEEEH